MDFTSVNDELLALKKRLRALGKEVVKIEKVGNGNMSAFELFYREPGQTEVKRTYFWRHDIENFIKQLEA
ncbi:MAG: hypothetical protein JNM21_04970 [Taibaiella sp.]|nr:hypothetical protein [Taibaiella sp.]